MSERKASVQRNTLETQIQVKLNVDGGGGSQFKTGIPFLEHMLDQVARHGMFDIEIVADGDLHIDAHHSVEDIGITLGQAFAQAVGDKRGIRRYGHAYVPLDEALSRVVIDFSGRPGLEYTASYPRARIGEFDVDLLHEFFQGFCNHAMVTLHIDNLQRPWPSAPEWRPECGTKRRFLQSRIVTISPCRTEIFDSATLTNKKGSADERQQQPLRD